MKKKWWNERTRLILTLELAVTLPAAALIAFSLWNLRSIHRDKAVEAAIRQDFDQVLAIAEKRINEKAYDLVSSVREEFPCYTDPVAQKLDEILAQHPYAAHVYFFDEEVGWVFRSQPGRMKEKYFQKESKEFFRWGEWIRMEAKDMVSKLHKLEEKEDEKIYLDYECYAHHRPALERLWGGRSGASCRGWRDSGCL